MWRVSPHIRTCVFIQCTAELTYCLIMVQFLSLLVLFSPLLGCQCSAGMKKQECCYVNGIHLVSISTFPFILTAPMPSLDSRLFLD